MIVAAFSICRPLLSVFADLFYGNNIRLVFSAFRGRTWTTEKKLTGRGRLHFNTRENLESVKTMSRWNDLRGERAFSPLRGAKYVSVTA